MKRFQKVYVVCQVALFQMKQVWKEEKGEFALSTVIGIAIGLIVAAFVLIPGIKGFAEVVVKDMENWWSSAVSSEIFPKK